MSRTASQAPPNPPTSDTMAMATLMAMANVSRRRSSRRRPERSAAASPPDPVGVTWSDPDDHGRSGPVPTVIDLDGTPGPGGTTLHPADGPTGLGFCRGGGLRSRRAYHRDRHRTR